MSNIYLPSVKFWDRSVLAGCALDQPLGWWFIFALEKGNEKICHFFETYSERKWVF